MKLVIIAGGKGTRLGFQEIPKPMVKIGEKPILQYQIELAAKYGIEEIFILSGYLSEVIKDYFAAGEKFGVNITHVVEPQPLGTAGAVKQLEDVIDERFMVLYGDTVLDVDLNKFIEFDKALDYSIATIFVHPNNHPYDSDLIEMDNDNLITAFHSKLHEADVNYQNMVSAGFYILSPEIFKYLKIENTDFGKNVFPVLISETEKMYGYLSHEYIKDMGTTDRLEQTKKDLTSGKVARMNFNHSKKVVFIDRDGVINEEVDNLSNIDDFRLIENVPKAIKKINKSEFLSVCITNQPVIAKGFISEEGLLEIHKKMDTLLGNEGAYLDRLYYCPHHPDKGFDGEVPELKYKCNCRKPETGMIDKAAIELNIDLTSSFFVGDTTSDIMTGINAGVNTVLVRTGYAGKDMKFDCKPDFICEDLEESIDFILGHENIYKKLKKILPSGSSQNRVILIGGLSRSGKSILSKMIAKILNEKGINSKILELDNWLVSVDDRTEDMDVRGRYRIDQIGKDINQLLSGNPVTIDQYDPMTRSTYESTNTVVLDENEILLLDGVVSLDIDDLRRVSKTKIYVEVNEETRKQRFIKLYQHKGLTKDGIIKLYHARQKDECCSIVKTKKFADHIITLEG